MWRQTTLLLWPLPNDSLCSWLRSDDVRYPTAGVIVNDDYDHRLQVSPSRIGEKPCILSDRYTILGIIIYIALCLEHSNNTNLF